MIDAMLAFTVSLFVVIIYTAICVEATPQGPILFLSGVAGLLCVMITWICIKG